MNSTYLLEMSNIYEQTTVIVGIESLIMGVTLLVLRNTLKNSSSRSKSGLSFLALSMFALSIFNLLEYTTGIEAHNERYSLSIVIFAASIEMFLLFTTYMTMLSKEFITRRRILLELGCIALFTTPAMFVSPENHLQLFNVLFIIGQVFYGVKLACNYIEYMRQIKKAKTELENYLSSDSGLWLRWINNTFLVMVTIGVVSAVAPMTNLIGLIIYNSFIFFAYFYIYITVINNIYIYDKMSVLENDEPEYDESESNELLSIEQECLNECLPSPDKEMKLTTSFISSRQQLLDDWIACRGYAITGITANEVAKRLKTSRTKLSYYLNTELNTTYYDWIANLRVEDAKKQLIDHPDRTVYEIALSVGIEDRDNFRHVFQRYVGISPRAYRKQQVGWD